MGIISIRKYAQRLLAPVIIVLCLAMTIGMFYIGFPIMGKEVTSYRGKAVKLNGEVVKDAEFQNYLDQASQQASQYAQYGITVTDAQIRDTALKMAVNNLAFKAEMEKYKSKIKATTKDAEAMIKKYLPTEEELQNFMDQQGYANKKELTKAVVEDIKRQKFILLKAKELKIKVTKAEVLEQLEQVTVSHILIGLNDSSNKPIRTEAEALARANEVYAKASSNSDFAALAKEYSDDPGSKDKGGVYGPMSIAQFKSSMVKEFVDGALALKAGEVSKPIKTEYGYHVIRLDKREMPKGADYKKKYQEAADSILLSKVQQSPVFEKWLTKLNEKAAEKMEILDPALRAYQLASKEKWAEAASAYEKALKLKYYKKRWDVYMDASSVYLKMKQPAKALEVLKKVAVEGQDNIDYKVALATVYKENNQPKKAQQILTAFGAKNPDDKTIHQRLQQQFTEWKMTQAATKEAATVARIEKKEADDAKKYQQELEQQQLEQEASTKTQSSQSSAQTETK